MARVAPIQNSLIGGELSPRLYGRDDIDKYGYGAKTIENCVVAPHGGGYSRPGFYFLNETKDSTKLSKLIEFEFSDQQAYIIEMGEGYFRWFTNGGYIQDTENLITNGDFPANITGWTDLSAGAAGIAWHASGVMRLTPSGADDAVAEQSIAFVTDGVPFALEFEIVNGASAGNEVTVKVGTSSGASDLYTATYDTNGIKGGSRSVVVTPALGTSTVYLQFIRTGTGTTDIDNVEVYREILEIANPYGENDLAGIQFAQSADVMYMVHPDYSPRKLARASNVAWTFTEIDFFDGPYNPRNFDTTAILTTTGTYTVGGTCTITATGSGFAPFTAAMVGQVIRLEDTDDATKNFWAVIAGFTSSTVVTATVKVAVPAELQATGTYKWQLAAFSAANGYPSAVGLSGQRLWFGCTAAKPQTFWGSVLSDLETFTPGNDSDLAIIFTIAAKKPHKVQWIADSNGGLIVGTRGAEWLISGNGAPLTPTNIDAVPKTSRGSDSIQPIEAGYALLMVQKFGHKIRELKTNDDINGYVSPNMLIMSEHLTRNKTIVDIAYQAETESLLWCALSDGSFISATYEPEQEVISWQRHSTDGEVEALASIPGESSDDLYAIVKRTINGSVVRNVEQMQPIAYQGIQNSFFVDCGLTYTGPSYDVVSVTLANPMVVRIDIGSSAYSFTGPGDQSLAFTGVGGTTEINGNAYLITASSLVSGTQYDITLDVDASAFTAYTSGGIAKYGTKTIAGLGHLEGETVSILADGGVEDTQAVSSGVVTLSEPANIVHAGLPYTQTIGLLEPSVGSQNGTARAKQKRYNELFVLLSETAGCTINGQQVPFRRINDEMGKPVELFTGYKGVRNLGWSKEAPVTIEQQQPLPMNVLMITGTLTVSDS